MKVCGPPSPKGPGDGLDLLRLLAEHPEILRELGQDIVHSGAHDRASGLICERLHGSSIALEKFDVSLHDLESFLAR